MAGIRLMCIWLLAYHLYYYGKREVTLARENARLALVAKDAQLNNLHAQLNPHFLFNSLNTIKALVIDDPSSARRAVDLMSDMLRLSLYYQELILHPLKDELSLVGDYLEMEKLRLEERLQFSIEFPPELAEAHILRYSVQVLVENAIKHGISRQRSGGLLRIVIMQEDGVISTCVQNPGKLDTAASLHGLGLKNLKERLQLHYQDKAVFTISEAKGTVSAYILIPVV
ncbi:autolysin sensor kinase [Filimonas lacunae]|nr:autolysin sensor kinase [Filimonas lacunae]